MRRQKRTEQDVAAIATFGEQLQIRNVILFQGLHEHLHSSG